MSDPRNVAHDKKVIQVKQKHGEDLAKDAAHIPQPGKKTAHKKEHGAHKESDAEESGGHVTPEPDTAAASGEAQDKAS